MIESHEYQKIQSQLVGYLTPVFDDVSVEIGDGLHYEGTNIVVTSKHFTGLLAEQRFHHVVRALPENLYNDRLRRGVVWFELAPGETGMDLMQMPRADDVRKDEGIIEARLRDAGFFSKLHSSIKKSDDPPSVMRFDAARKQLVKCGFEGSEVERACLFFIGHGAFCDAHVVNDLASKYLSESAA